MVPGQPFPLLSFPLSLQSLADWPAVDTPRSNGLCERGRAEPAGGWEPGPRTEADYLSHRPVSLLIPALAGSALLLRNSMHLLTHAILELSKA